MKQATHTHGFTLLEMASVVAIIAFVVTLGLGVSQNALDSADRVSTQQKLATIKRALDLYGQNFGYLPCPARRDLAPSSASFGLESRSGTSCTTSGSSIVNVPSGTPTVFIGALPHRTLNLPDSYASDSWGGKLLYAVSNMHVGRADSYMTVDGPITVRTGNRLGTNYIVTTKRDGTAGPAATYVVLSHGPNAKGAYTAKGTTVPVACGGGNGNDVENCNDTNAVFYDTVFSDGPNATAFFDDIIVWGTNLTSYRASSSSGSLSPPTTSSSSSSGGDDCTITVAKCLNEPPCGAFICEKNIVSIDPCFATCVWATIGSPSSCTAGSVFLCP